MVLNVPPGAYITEDAALFTGEMRLTVTRIGDVRVYGNEKYVTVEGQQKHPQGPWEQRRVGINIKALRAALTSGR